MKKKGFTLIELLAVIVILAIIALIATPIILKVIEDAKKNAAVDSAYGYIEAIEFNNAMAEVKKEYQDKKIITDETLESVNSKINVKGEKATEISSLVITKEKVTHMNMCINGYIIEYKDGIAKTLDKCDNKKGPSLTLGTSTILPNSITIPYTTSSDSEQEEIISVTCKYGTSMDNYTEEGTISNNKCILSNLTSTSKYYYQITATNEAGKSTSVIGNATTIKSEIAEIAKALVYDGDTCKTDGTTYTFMDGCYLKGKPTNNYVSYGGYVWRIMGINSDGSVRMIINSPFSNVRYDPSSQTYSSSEINKWLNTTFYEKLSDTDGVIQEGTYFCSEKTTSKTSKRTTCGDEYVITSKVGIISLDEYNLAGASSSQLFFNSAGHWTMTPSSGSLVWYVLNHGSGQGIPVTNTNKAHPIINIKTNKTITEGNGTSGSPYKLS